MRRIWNAGVQCKLFAQFTAVPDTQDHQPITAHAIAEDVFRSENFEYDLPILAMPFDWMAKIRMLFQDLCFC